MTVRQAHERLYYIAQNTDIRHFSKEPNPLSCIQTTCSFVGNAFTNKTVDEIKSIDILYRLITTTNYTENLIICAANIHEVSRILFLIDNRFLSYLPIKTGEGKSFFARRSLMNNSTKTVPGFFSN
jgi:hypothetical protein